MPHALVSRDQNATSRQMEPLTENRPQPLAAFNAFYTDIVFYTTRYLLSRNISKIININNNN